MDRLKLALTISVHFILLSATVAASPTDEIADVALHGLMSLEIQHGKTFLFGRQTNGPDTKSGRLACAKVVSIVLNHVGLTAVYTGVASLEDALRARGWHKIGNPRNMRVSDVVILTPKIGGHPKGNCTGSGTCHVGIMTRQGVFHNDPQLARPAIAGPEIAHSFQFKIAYRRP